MKDIKAKYNNTYNIELTNDANYLVTGNDNTYCFKCGSLLDDENSLNNRFCDSECRREYYAEVSHDLRGLEY